MNDYQPKRNNPYLLPDNLYREVKYMVKDYGRLKEEYKALDKASEEERNWARLCTTASKIAAIRAAIAAIPREYRDGVLNNLQNENSRKGYYPINADYRTYQGYKQKLIYTAARNMNYV